MWHVAPHVVRLGQRIAPYPPVSVIAAPPWRPPTHVRRPRPRAGGRVFGFARSTRVGTVATVQIPTAQLRVFVPLETFPGPARRRWELVVAGGHGASRQDAEAAGRRLNLAVQQGRSLPADDLALVRRVGAVPYVCPLDLPLRAGRAYARLLDHYPESVVAAFVPDSAARRRLAALARSGRHPHVRDHAFEVPVAWYAAFAPVERRRVDPLEGTGPRTRFMTRVTQAVSRLEATAASLATVAPDEDIDAVEDLARWLDGFPGAGLVELDYGDLSRRLPDEQDRVVDDLVEAREAADHGDSLAAATALARARARWSASADQPDYS